MARYVLTITELAKLKQITSETLRHYDRIGLLKPDHISESGHRYYSIRQYERLGTILELKKIGMSLKEIQEYFNNRNFEKSYQMLKKYQEEFEKNLQEQIHLNEILLQKLEFLDNLSSLPEMETVFEKEFPVRHIVTFGREAGDREEHAMAFTKLESYIKEEIPILASDRVGVFADERLLIPSEELIPAVPMLLVSPKNAEESYLQKIPGGKYVCMYYRNGILEKYHPSFEKIKSYIRDKKYRIHGKILQIYKVDVTLTSNAEETVMELQIPVV
ncbi:MerR family transcriptional regulator [Lacrimispora saccharolytica]|nr:MerR family transcriptional regulator [Lacrimispora saccharolytica]